MNTEEKAKAYDEALGRAKSLFGNSPIGSERAKICSIIFHQLAESENERIREAIESIIRVYGKTRGEWIAGYDMDTLVVHLRDAFTYLEKQKDLDKMIVVSPEVWDEAIADAYENGKKEGEKQKECLADNSKTSASEDERIREELIGALMWQRDCLDAKGPHDNNLILPGFTMEVGDILEWLEKQKEQNRVESEGPHYTKRNALFDKCVEKCNPDVMKKVSDDVDRLLQKEQKPVKSDTEKEYVRILKSIVSDFIRDKKPKDALLYQDIFDWLDGRHIEQKPTSQFHPGDWVVYDGPLGHAILQIEDVLDGRYTFVDNDSTLLVEDSDKFLRPITPEDVEKKSEWSEEDIKKIRSEEYTKGFNDAAFGGKIKEWSVEDEDRIRQIERIAQEAGCTQKLQEEIHDWLKSRRPQPQGTYKQVIHTIFGMLKDKDFYEIQPSHRVSLLNDIRVKCKDAIECAPILDEPSWKPSEEQMNALERTVRLANFGLEEDRRKTLISLCEHLKKLM